MRPSNRSGWPHRAAIAFLVALCVVAAFIVGRWSAGSVGVGPLTVQGYIAGRVAYADNYGGGICISPAAGGAEQCGSAFYQPGTFTLRKGDKARVAVETLPLPGGGSSVIWVVVVPHP